MTDAKIRAWPRAYDWVWLVCDRDNHVGAFVTAGAGPIPTAILESSLPAEEGEKLIRSLAPTTTVHASPRPGDVESFVTMAHRGVFVYDWQGAYELVAAPDEPVRVDFFQGQLAEISSIVRLANVSFAGERVVDICRHTPCLADYQLRVPHD